MSLVPEVKCRRCGTRFSALRSRCPNCGIRRVSQSARTPGVTPNTVKGTASYERAATNTKWQLIFGLILVVAVILAVVVLVSTSLNGEAQQGSSPNIPTPKQDEPAMPTPDAAPTPTPTPTPSVEKVDIMFYTTVYKDENGPSMYDGEELDFTATAWPANIENPKYVWSTSDESCIKLTPSTEDNGHTCTISCIAEIPGGGVKVTVECFGVESSMVIYRRAK